MSIKHEINIEEDVFVVAKRFFNGIIGGEVYRGDDQRPADSNKEDAVVVVSFANVGQFQDASVYVNVYVPDKAKKSRFVADKARLTQISNMSDSLLEELTDEYIGEYYFEYNERANKIFAEPNIKQHWVSMNFLVKRQTFN